MAERAPQVRRVAAGGDHAPVAASDDHRDVAQFRTVAFLDGGVEGVAVDMGDGEAVEFLMPQDARQAGQIPASGRGRRPQSRHGVCTGRSWKSCRPMRRRAVRDVGRCRPHVRQERQHPFRATCRKRG